MGYAERTIPTQEEYAAYRQRLSNWGRWGADDQFGTLNFITPEVTRAAVALVRDGRNVSCSRLLTTKAVMPNEFRNPKPAEIVVTVTPPADGGDVAPAAEAPRLAILPWDAPLEERVATVERAAEVLGRDDRPLAAVLIEAVGRAVAEIGAPASTVPVAGQDTRMRYDTPRGVGVVSANGTGAVWWLVAPLLAGNAVALVDSPALLPVVQALHEAGVPRDVLTIVPGGVGTVVALAGTPAISFVACDGGSFRSFSAAIAGVVAGQSGMKALLSSLDGPQPTEPGFMRRFAWPKVIAIRTLRHGADLALSSVDPAR